MTRDAFSLVADENVELIWLVDREIWNNTIFKP